jgi:hypothetical protein
LNEPSAKKTDTEAFHVTDKISAADIDPLSLHERVDSKYVELLVPFDGEFMGIGGQFNLETYSDSSNTCMTMDLITE